MIVFLPEILIFLASIILLFFKNKFSDLESKKVFSIAKIFLVLSFIASLAIYNNQLKPTFMHTNPRIMFLSSALYIYAIIWLNLSSRWFANKSKSGVLFASFALLQILCSLLLLSAKNLIYIGCLITALYLINYLMLTLKKHYQDYAKVTKSYKVSAFVLMGLYWTGVIIFNYNQGVAILFIFPAALYLLGIAPFHKGFVDIVSKTILPISGLTAAVNIVGYLVLLNYLSRFVFNDVISMPLILKSFGLFSLFLGAIYASMQTNIRKVMAYSSVFHMGVILLGISFSSEFANIGTYIYFLIYTASMFGMFCTFYALKQSGEYQKDICNLYGIAHQKTFVISLFTIFLISLIGYPPIIGFAGRISLINTLISSNSYIFAGLYLLALMILISGYLNIIKAFYFTPAINKKYDRVDLGVYLVLTIYVVFIIATILSPAIFTQYIQEVFYK